jgi:hypothetical protein
MAEMNYCVETLQQSILIQRTLLSIAQTRSPSTSINLLHVYNLVDNQNTKTLILYINKVRLETQFSSKILRQWVYRFYALFNFNSSILNAELYTQRLIDQ